MEEKSFIKILHFSSYSKYKHRKENMYTHRAREREEEWKRAAKTTAKNNNNDTRYIESRTTSSPSCIYTYKFFTKISCMYARSRRGASIPQSIGFLLLLLLLFLYTKYLYILIHYIWNSLAAFQPPSFFIFFSPPADNKFSNIHHLLRVVWVEMTMVEYLWYFFADVIRKKGWRSCIHTTSRLCVKNNTCFIKSWRKSSFFVCGVCVLDQKKSINYQFILDIKQVHTCSVDIYNTFYILLSHAYTSLPESLFLSAASNFFSIPCFTVKKKSPTTQTCNSSSCMEVYWELEWMYIINYYCN